MGLKFTARKTKAQNNHKNKKGNGFKKSNKNKGNSRWNGKRFAKT